jgi:hypothetical protein
MTRVIVPLIVAGAAQAVTLALPSGNYTCSYTMNAISGTGSACRGGATTLTNPGVLNGVGFWLAVGGLDLGSQGGSIIMDTIGREPALSAGTAIPVSWVFDFSLADGGGPGDPAWQLNYTLDDVTSDTILAHESFSGVDFGLVTGNGLITTTASSNAGDILDVRVRLVELGDPEDGYDLQVRIPEYQTIDVGNVPEPATFGLAGAGLAWLGWQARKRRRHLN